MAIGGRFPCNEHGCDGAAIFDGRCAGHVTGAEFHPLSEELAQRRVLNLQGTDVWASQLANLVRAARGGETAGHGEALLALLLDDATIKGDITLVLPVRCYASFERARFLGEVRLQFDADCPMSFDGAFFEQRVALGGVMRHHVSFRGAHFARDVQMVGCVVGGRLDLAAATFGGGVDLSGTIAGVGLTLEGSDIPRAVSLSGTRLAMDVGDLELQDERIDAADGSWWRPIHDPTRDFVPLLQQDQHALRERYGGWAPGVWIRSVVFRSRFAMSQAAVGGDELAFERSHFEDGVDLGDTVLASRRVRFGHSRFARMFAAQVAGEVLDCRDDAFDGGVELDVATDSLVVEQCWFGRASLIRRSDRPTTTGAAPRLLSLRGSDVERLRLANLDLSAMRLANASSLDDLRIEGPLRFAKPPQRRLTPRDVLADEWAWRAKHDLWIVPAGAHWSGVEAYVDLAPPATLDATEVASLYRALRKGREDERDEPGAADFYYGEMEMRRRTPGSPAKSILHAYWLTSGYALRPIRAFLTLLAVIAAFAIAFDAAGFAEPPRAAAGAAVVGAAAPESSQDPDMVDALVFSAGTATAVLNAPSRPLTRTGDVLRVLLRILGPVLAGLTLLAIRGRVKR